jgi:cytochrome c biogenesis protein CcmG/thiol:disulfide interchange protein DsbE
MFVSVAVAVLVVALSAFLGTRHPVGEATSAPSPLLGKMAPALVGSELGGGRFNLRQDLGRVVVVNFWASWCGPCIEEAPNLSTFAFQERGDQVSVIGVVYDDTVAAATAFAAHYGSLYPSMIDRNGQAALRYGVTDPPTTFVIDARGRVEASLLGPVSTAQLTAVVKRVQE